MKKPIKFGGDAGNSALKLAVEGLESPIYIPAIYTEAIEYGLDHGVEEEKVADVLNHLDLTITTPTIKEQKRLIIGNKVAEDGLMPGYLPIGSKKSREEFPLLLTLGGLAAAAVKLNPGKSNIRIEYEGSISLPVTQIQPEEAEHAENRLMGSHTVIIHLPNETVTVTMYIVYVKCVPEGAIASYDLIYDFKGNVKNEVYLDALIQHFDIGDGTTEMPVTRGVKYQTKLSRGLKIGVASPLDNIIQTFNLNHDHYEIRSRRHVYEIYTDKKHKVHEELKRIADPQFKQISNLLGTQFKNQLANAQDVTEIVAHGGGAELLREHLVTDMKKRGYNMIVLDNPVYATANGLLKFTLSPRFAKFKEKKLGTAESAAASE